MRLLQSQLDQVLSQASQVKLGVIGEICLDRYIIGDMAGISREAPIPIVNVDSDEYLPGGGGNTTLNARGLGVQVYPLGVVGDDLAADIMFREFHNRGISTDLMVREKGRRTQCYSKVYASSYRGKIQQVARFDHKNYQPVSADSETRVLQNLELLITQVDALIVADYAEVAGTGTITETIFERIRAIAKTDRLITMGDSRERLAQMQHFTAVVPNDIEVAMALFPQDYLQKPFQQDDHACEYAKLLQKQLHCRYVIMTRGERGALIAPEDMEPIFVPTVPIEGEIDVTGAGDCFAATLTAALVLNVDVPAAVELANIAAGITVQKLNTTGIATPDEIRHAFMQSMANDR